jgi:hypothetical protein
MTTKLVEKIISNIDYIKNNEDLFGKEIVAKNYAHFYYEGDDETPRRKETLESRKDTKRLTEIYINSCIYILDKLYEDLRYRYSDSTTKNKSECEKQYISQEYKTLKSESQLENILKNCKKQHKTYISAKHSAKHKPSAKPPIEGSPSESDDYDFSPPAKPKQKQKQDEPTSDEPINKSKTKLFKDEDEVEKIEKARRKYQKKKTTKRNLTKPTIEEDDTIKITMYNKGDEHEHSRVDLANILKTVLGYNKSKTQSKANKTKKSLSQNISNDLKKNFLLEYKKLNKPAIDKQDLLDLCTNCSANTTITSLENTIRQKQKFESIGLEFKKIIDYMNTRPPTFNSANNKTNTDNENKFARIKAVFKSISDEEASSDITVEELFEKLQTRYNKKHNIKLNKNSKEIKYIFCYIVFYIINVKQLKDPATDTEPDIHKQSSDDEDESDPSKNLQPNDVQNKQYKEKFKDVYGIFNTVNDFLQICSPVDIDTSPVEDIFSSENVLFGFLGPNAPHILDSRLRGKSIAKQIIDNNQEENIIHLFDGHGRTIFSILFWLNHLKFKNNIHFILYDFQSSVDGWHQLFLNIQNNDSAILTATFETKQENIFDYVNNLSVIVNDDVGGGAPGEDIDVIQEGILYPKHLVYFNFCNIGGGYGNENNLLKFIINCILRQNNSKQNTVFYVSCAYQRMSGVMPNAKALFGNLVATGKCITERVTFRTFKLDTRNMDEMLYILRDAFSYISSGIYQGLAIKLLSSKFGNNYKEFEKSLQDAKAQNYLCTGDDGKTCNDYRMKDGKLKYLCFCGNESYCVNGKCVKYDDTYHGKIAEYLQNEVTNLLQLSKDSYSIGDSIITDNKKPVDYYDFNVNDANQTALSYYSTAIDDNDGMKNRLTKFEEAEGAEAEGAEAEGAEAEGADEYTIRDYYFKLYTKQHIAKTFGLYIEKKSEANELELIELYQTYSGEFYKQLDRRNKIDSKILAKRKVISKIERFLKQKNATNYKYYLKKLTKEVEAYENGSFSLGDILMLLTAPTNDKERKSREENLLKIREEFETSMTSDPTNLITEENLTNFGLKMYNFVHSILLSDELSELDKITKLNSGEIPIEIFFSYTKTDKTGIYDFKGTKDECEILSESNNSIADITKLVHIKSAVFNTICDRTQDSYYKQYMVVVGEMQMGKTNFMIAKAILNLLCGVSTLIIVQGLNVDKQQLLLRFRNFWSKMMRKIVVPTPSIFDPVYFNSHILKADVLNDGFAFTEEHPNIIIAIANVDSLKKINELLNEKGGEDETDKEIKQTINNRDNLSVMIDESDSVASGKVNTKEESIYGPLKNKEGKLSKLITTDDIYRKNDATQFEEFTLDPNGNYVKCTHVIKSNITIKDANNKSIKDANGKNKTYEKCTENEKYYYFDKGKLDDKQLKIDQGSEGAYTEGYCEGAQAEDELVYYKVYDTNVSTNLLTDLSTFNLVERDKYISKITGLNFSDSNILQFGEDGKKEDTVYNVWSVTATPFSILSVFNVPVPNIITLVPPDTYVSITDITNESIDLENTQIHPSKYLPPKFLPEEKGIEVTNNGEEIRIPNVTLIKTTTMQIDQVNSFKALINWYPEDIHIVWYGTEMSVYIPGYICPFSGYTSYLDKKIIEKILNHIHNNDKEFQHIQKQHRFKIETCDTYIGNFSKKKSTPLLKEDENISFDINIEGRKSSILTTNESDAYNIDMVFKIIKLIQFYLRMTIGIPFQRNIYIVSAPYSKRGISFAGGNFDENYCDVENLNSFINTFLKDLTTHEYEFTDFTDFKNMLTIRWVLTHMYYIKKDVKNTNDPELLQAVGRLCGTCDYKESLKKLHLPCLITSQEISEQLENADHFKTQFFKLLNEHIMETLHATDPELRDFFLRTFKDPAGKTIAKRYSYDQLRKLRQNYTTIDALEIFGETYAVNVNFSNVLTHSVDEMLDQESINKDIENIG